MSSQKILCSSSFAHKQKETRRVKKVHVLLKKKKNPTKSVLAFLSKVIYTCSVMAQERCSYLFCVDFWAEILALSKIVELQSLARVGQIFQPFASSILSPCIFLRRLTRNTAQIQLSTERHSNFNSSHFKAVWFLLGLLLSTSISLFSYCSGN